MSTTRGKVLFLATVYSHLAQFHIPFISLLQSKGYIVHAAASIDGNHIERVRSAGAVCWDIPFARSPYHPQNVSAFLQLKSLFSREHYDLVHVHTPIAAFLGRYLAKSTHQGPVLYTAHGFHFFKGAPLRNWLVYYSAEKVAARWTDALIVMNSEDYGLAQKIGFQPGKNLFYTHGVGVDLREFAGTSSGENGVRTELGIDAHQPVVACIGELSNRKNQSFLLDGWSLLAQRLQIGHLLLVGTGGYLDALKGRVHREGIPRVHFLGYRTDVPGILAQSDIVALVSKHEGLPRCLMEAMSAGKPIVASNVRGNRDLVEHRKTGFLVDLGDIASLASAMETLMVNPELRKSMGAAARERVQAYALDGVLSEMNSIYEAFMPPMQNNP
jgi:glycosyltransferase involved in cell wall biosynthesis